MSAAAASPPREITPEEFASMPDAHRWELIDGQLVEREMSSYGSVVAVNLIIELAPSAKQASGLLGGSDCGLKIFSEYPKRVIFPDACYFSSERMPRGLPLRGWTTVAPDLVVEVISPGEFGSPILGKVLDYLRAGVRLVWTIYPELRAVMVHYPDRTSITLIGDAVLTGEDVLPGFAVPISALFPPVDEDANTGEDNAPVSSED